jgi:hypothetical protein
MEFEYDIGCAPACFRWRTDDDDDWSNTRSLPEECRLCGTDLCWRDSAGPCEPTVAHVMFNIEEVPLWAECENGHLHVLVPAPEGVPGIYTFHRVVH